MIIFYGLKRKPEIARVIATLGLVLGDDYSIIDNVQALAFLPEDVGVVVCGLKYAKECGINGKFSALNGTTVFSATLGRDVYITSSLNSMQYNPNVVQDFISKMKSYLTVDYGINYEPQHFVIERPSEFNDNSAIGDKQLMVFDIESSGVVFTDRLAYPNSKDRVLFTVFAYNYDEAFMVDRQSFVTYKDEWQAFFSRKDITFVAHNGKFDILGMRRDLDLHVRIDFDTLMAHHRISSEEIHKLKVLLANKYGFPDYDKLLDKFIYKDVHTKEAKYDRIPREVFYPYAALDGVGTLRLALDLFNLLQKLHMVDTFFSVDMPFLNAVARNEFHGRYIDIKWLGDTARSQLQPLIQLNQHTIRTMVGRPKLNVNSTKQMSELFQALNFPRYKKQMGTARPVLEKLATYDLTDSQRKLLELLTDFRSNKKIQTSYVNNVYGMIDKDYYVYPEYNIAGTVVYRTSCKRPAIQTIPKTAAGRFIRQSYVAKKGFAFTHIDGAASQLRLAGALSQDSVMLDVFNNHGDLHDKTLSGVYEYLPQYLKDDASLARRIAKNTNFGLIFLQTIFGLQAKMPYVPKEISALLHQSFYDTYPEYIKWGMGIVNDAKRDLFVDNIFGYRHTFPAITSRLSNQAINHPISSAEAYIFNKSYAELTNMGFHVALHLHDELAVYHRIEDSKIVAETMMRTMLNNYMLVNEHIPIPMTFAVDGNTRTRWKLLDNEKPLHKWNMDTNEL